MTRRFGLPLAASLVGHGCLLVALILFIGKVPVLPLPAPPRGIEIMLAPPPVAPPKPQPPPIPPAPPQPAPPPPVVHTTPPPPPPPPRQEQRRVVIQPPPRRPPPERKPARIRENPPPPPEREIVRRPEPEREFVPPPRYLPPPTRYVPYPPQTAALPPQPPLRPASPLVSPGYRAELNAWFASHKEYPESARERGEEGQVLLHFRVDRSGRVLSYSLGGSTGYPDLDAAVQRMMQGAVLPPFPADMAANEIPVSVTIRFGLR